jgi:recA bacterial DNA recombination protein
MSSLLVCAQPAPGYPVAFPQEGSAFLLKRISALPKLAAVTPASRLEVRPTPEMVSSGIRELDALTGGLPRGCLTEICGPASSGRTSVLVAALAAATQRQEACALVDTTDAFDPVSAAAAGVNFERLLWVRCGVYSPPGHPSAALRAGSDTEKIRNNKNDHRSRMDDSLEQALRVTDLLLQSRGFGMVAIDLGGVPFRSARRIPLTSWFRFQRAVESTPTVLFVIAEAPCAPSCAALLLKLQSGKKPSAFSHQPSRGAATEYSPGREPGVRGAEDGESLQGRQRSGDTEPLAVPAHAQLLEGLDVEGELLRSRLERKPVRSAAAAFATRAVRIS